MICDNLATHRNKDAAQALKDVVCWVLYLPSYSLDLNLIEIAFSKLKAHLRKIGARICDQMFNALAEVCDLFKHENAETTFAKQAIDQVKAAKLYIGSRRKNLNFHNFAR